MPCLSLSSLEVQELDSVGEHEEEQQDPAHVGNNHGDKEVSVETQYSLRNALIGTGTAPGMSRLVL